MNRVRRRKEIQPPPGWDDVKDLILSLNEDMRIAEATNNDANSSQEQLWTVLRCNWKRSRPVFEMYWRQKSMSKDLYEWILKNNYADRDLINAWRRPGYDRLCCVACISKNTDHGGVCLCRIPKAQRKQKEFKCIHCGCPGCFSGDYDDLPDDTVTKEQNEQTNENPQNV
ncbi:G10 protein [Tritrichomonas foetus]|uniref:G10 protein n=1 Tax=Tritrichomonas foetus TaxID=1144522 RepID=A0A1J4JVN0_9EUKA|nr:G10 protein [Tritrichomonas foetus]|eukprot:OHT02488.1 G10 protein [Tritrichomonas foetus]